MIKTDYLPNTSFSILQDSNQYHFNSDTTLLGQFLKIKRKDHVLDIGCNSGALMLYASLSHPSLLCGIDLFEETIEIAKRNMELNHIEAELYVSDLKDFQHDVFDILICNPPYFSTNKPSLKNDNKYKKAARHEDFLTLKDLFYHSNRLLKDLGYLYLVHRPERFNDLIVEAKGNGLSLCELQIVYDKKTKKSRTLLLKYRKSKSSQVSILEPLYI